MNSLTQDFFKLTFHTVWLLLINWGVIWYAAQLTNLIVYKGDKKSWNGNNYKIYSYKNLNGWRMDPTAYVLYVCGSTCSSYSDQPVAPDEMIGYNPFDYLKFSKRNFKIYFIFLIFHRDFQKQKWNINLPKV